EKGPLSGPERVLRVGAGVVLLVPNAWVAGPAAAIGLTLVALHRVRHRDTEKSHARDTKEIKQQEETT
ncbi:MAG: hypothetical protein AAGH87_11670, partial [Pseudomonadota bacterium]